VGPPHVYAVHVCALRSARGRRDAALSAALAGDRDRR
jgi:hypothetical protein